MSDVGVQHADLHPALDEATGEVDEKGGPAVSAAPDAGDGSSPEAPHASNDEPLINVLRPGHNHTDPSPDPSCGFDIGPVLGERGVACGDESLLPSHPD